MIEGIGIALRTYYDTATQAKQILESAMKEIGDNYIGAKYAELVGQAKDAFNTTMDECRTENYNACLAVLDEVSANVKKVVEMPVPTDFTATLEALKKMEHPTPREVETVVGAYKNNYFAYRAICDFLKVSEQGIRPTTIDDIEDDIADIRSNLHRCFFSDNLDAYHFQNWLEGSTTLARYDEIFTAFLEGRFEDVMTSEGDNNKKKDTVIEDEE